VKTQLLHLGLLVGLPLASAAQASGSVRALPVTFYTAEFQPSTAQDSTAYCVETTFRDSVSLGGVTRVYFPSGALKQYIPYANVYRRIVHGTLTNWYEDGRMRTKEDFLNGQRHGDLLTYYPDGTLKRREHYEQGRCGIGNCYGPDGAAVPYFVYEQLPLYPGGEEQLLKELKHALRLNSQEVVAMRRETGRMPYNVVYDLRRQVDVELTVTNDGRVASARVVHSTANFLNNAALRAVTKLKRRFVPGRRDGQVLMSFLTVPVYYTLGTYQPYNGGYNRSYRMGPH
jgi:protein TonB